jgi:membrane protease YdiL (CAAX protease family)
VSFLPQILRRFWSWLVPPRRNRLVPWSGLEIIVVLLLTQFFWFNLTYSALSAAGYFERVYGPEFAQHTPQDVQSAEPNPELYRASMWLTVLCLPLNVATVLGVCALLSGTRPYQLGLTTHRLGRNVLLGTLGALLVAPLHVLKPCVDVLYQQILHVQPTPHPLTLVARHALPVDRVMIVLSAVMAAPVMEELLFRGLLQPWFSRRRLGGPLAVLFALILALVKQQKDLGAAWAADDWGDLALALQPAAFVLVLAPGLLLTRRMARPDVAGGIYGTAVLFAAAHSSAWPDPIPLLPLGLVLGWLAYRTNSLVGPIFLHSLFNSIACVVMFSPYFR